MNMLASATSLSNRDLLARLPQLAANERGATAELVAHLVALEMRPDVYAAEGYGSLFAYCARALRLSEDAACTRLAAVSACRRFPQILDLLSSGAVTLTAVRRIGPHLTPGNCDSVMARAMNRTRSDIDVLVAELAPQPDLTPSVRKVPVRTTQVKSPAQAHNPSAMTLPMLEAATPAVPALLATAMPAPVTRPTPRPVIQPSAPERYRVQFTIGPEAHEELRWVQALLRREIPSGDPGLIFQRALGLLRATVERAKLGKTAKPRKRSSIRSETDNATRGESLEGRYIPNEVKRVVWERDGGRCAFVSASGHRCTERSYGEFHHLVPYALGGRATVENIALRCRRHNQHEARLVFGRHGESNIGEGQAIYPAEVLSAEWALAYSIPGPRTIASGAPRANRRRAVALSCASVSDCGSSRGSDASSIAARAASSDPSRRSAWRPRR